MRVISDTYRTSVFLIDRCHSLSHLIVPEGFPLTPSSCRREKKEKEKQVKKLTKTCGTVVSVCEQNRKTAFTLVNIWHVIQFKYLQKFVFCLILQFIKKSTCTRENRMCSISSSNTMDFVVLCVPQRTVKYPANYFSFIFLPLLSLFSTVWQQKLPRLTAIVSYAVKSLYSNILS